MMRFYGKSLAENNAREKMNLAFRYAAVDDNGS